MGTDSESIFGRMHRDELPAGRLRCAACTRKLGFNGCPWPAGGAGRIRSHYRYGGLRAHVFSITSPLHNYSGSSSGHGNATPDQVRSDRETLKYVPDGLLECPEKTHHFRLVWSLV